MGKDLLKRAQKALTMRGKIDKMHFIKIKDFCFSKDTVYISVKLHFSKIIPLALRYPALL